MGDEKFMREALALAQAAADEGGSLPFTGADLGVLAAAGGLRSGPERPTEVRQVRGAVRLGGGGEGDGLLQPFHRVVEILDVTQPLGRGEAAGHQADGGAFHITLAAGDLAGKAQARHGLHTQRAIEKLRRVEIGIAVQAAEACELGSL